VKEQRKHQRRHLIMYLKVYDVEANQLLGHLGDINPEGIMLVSEAPIETNKEFHLKMLLPREYTDQPFEFKARSLWCRNDINPIFYDTGFELLDQRNKDFVFIRELIEELGFQEA